ncbi:hypothetical protein JCM11641_005882 [Rhodosporidiobolus odoratus]
MSTPLLGAGSKPDTLLSTTPSASTSPAISRRPSHEGKRDLNAPSTPALGSPPPGRRPGLPPWLIVLGWIGLSTAVIFQNRSILVTKGFDHPVTLTTIHLAFQSVATRLLHRFTQLISGPIPQGEYAAVPLREIGEEEEADPGSERAQQERWKQQSVEMDWQTWAREILPIAGLFSLSLVLSNAAYLYCSVAFIHILKSFSPVAILLAAFVFRTKAFSLYLLGVVIVISVGVGIASYGEVAFSTIGFTIQMIAIAVEATRVTLIQILLNAPSPTTSSASGPPKATQNMSALKTLYFLAPVCFLINLLVAVILEGRPAFEAIPHLGAWTIASNASLTLLLNLSAVMLIGMSAMLLSLSKVVKDVLLVVSPALLLGESLTPMQVVGYGIATAGLLVYKFAPS